MKEKYSKTVTVYLPKGNYIKCKIYEYEEKLYIMVSKVNKELFNRFSLDCYVLLTNKKEYLEVYQNNNYWFLKTTI